MRVLALIALAGCGTVFQLDEVEELVPKVTGRVGFVTVLGADQVVDEPATGQIQLALAGDASAALPLAADGSFEFRVPEGDRYRVVATGFDSFPTEYISRSRTLTLGNISFGRRERTPASLPTPVSFVTNLPSDTPGVTRIVSTGHRTITDGGAGLEARLNWLDARAVEELTAPIGLLDQAAGDRLYFFHLGAGPTPNYNRMANMIAKDVTMVDGGTYAYGTTTAPEPVTPLPADRCVRVRVAFQDEFDRLWPMFGSQYTITTTWAVSSVPAREIGGGGRISLAFDTIGNANDTRDVVYPNPFPGESDVAAITISIRRFLTAPGTAVATELNNTLFAVAPVDATPNVTTCPDNVVDLRAARVPMLATATLGDQVLQADNQTIALDRSAPVPLVFSLLGSDPWDVVEVVLYEVAEESNRTELRPLRRLVTTEELLEIDPALFLRNRRYILAVTIRQQLVDAANGNFRDQTLPAATSTRYTPTFLVVN